VDGPLSKSGYTVSIGDLIMMEGGETEAASNKYTLVSGKDYPIRLSPTTITSRPIVAFLLRLEPASAGTAHVLNTTEALRPLPLTSQVVDSCPTGGLSQINHYSPNGPVAMDDPGQVGIFKLDGNNIVDTTVYAVVALTVTVVDSEYHYYSSSYSLGIANPTPLADSLTNSTIDFKPTDAPTANAVEATRNKTVPDDDQSSSSDTTGVSTTASSDEDDDMTRLRTIWIATACSLLVALGITIVTYKYNKKRRVAENDKSAEATASESEISVEHELV
jgi:hypothetical protein